MTARQTGILFLLGAIWGAAFMLIKIAVSDVRAATLVAVRIAITAVILYATMRVSGVTLPRERQPWFHFYSVGMFGLVIPFLLISWGQRLIPSSTTAILGAQHHYLLHSSISSPAPKKKSLSTELSD
jgi:drug/metabolite transporter (DMT)-like permease